MPLDNLVGSTNAPSALIPFVHFFAQVARPTLYYTRGVPPPTLHLIMSVIPSSSMSSIISGSVLPDGDSVQHQPDQEVSLRQPQKVVGLGIRRHRRDRGPTLSPGKMNSFLLPVGPTTVRPDQTGLITQSVSLLPWKVGISHSVKTVKSSHFYSVTVFFFSRDPSCSN